MAKVKIQNKQTGAIQECTQAQARAVLANFGSMWRLLPGKKKAKKQDPPPSDPVIFSDEDATRLSELLEITEPTAAEIEETKALEAKKKAADLVS